MIFKQDYATCMNLCLYHKFVMIHEILQALFYSLYANVIVMYFKYEVQDYLRHQKTAIMISIFYPLIRICFKLLKNAMCLYLIMQSRMSKMK